MTLNHLDLSAQTTTLAAARIAAQELHASLTWLKNLRPPYINAPGSFGDQLSTPRLLWMLPSLARFWVDERRKRAAVLQPVLDLLTAHRGAVIPWGSKGGLGDGWANSATTGLVRAVGEIERVIEKSNACPVLKLIEQAARKHFHWIEGFRLRACLNSGWWQ